MTRAGVAARHSTAPTITTVESGPWTLLRVPAPGRAATLAVHGDHSAAPAPITATGLSVVENPGTGRRRSSGRSGRPPPMRWLAGSRACTAFPGWPTSSPPRPHVCLAPASTSTAIFDPLTQVLKVHGTYGYPSLLVEHTRITPGEGIIGSVFQSGVAALRARRAGSRRVVQEPSAVSHQFVRRGAGSSRPTDPGRHQRDRPRGRSPLHQRRRVVAASAGGTGRPRAVTRAGGQRGRAVRARRRDRSAQRPVQPALPARPPRRRARTGAPPPDSRWRC